MAIKPKILLKPVSTSDQNTLRILALLEGSINNLNIYVEDFIETLDILKENLEKYSREGQTTKIEEVQENISHIELKVAEVTDSMQNIASEMSAFVDFQK